MNHLLAQRHVVIGMLAISCRCPTRLQEDIGCEGSGRRGRLKIGEQSKVTLIGTGDIRKVLASQWRIIVTVDRPTYVALGQQAEDRGTSEGLGRIIHGTLRCGRM